jgi:hypothetical protein
VNSGFKDIAAGEFKSGLAKLDADSEWRDDLMDLAGPFRLGFPGIQGFGEELLVASLIKRHAHATNTSVQVIASVESCHILKRDAAFQPRAKDCDGTSRSPLAILRLALVGELLNQSFIPLGSPLDRASNQLGRRPRIGIAWASVQGGRLIPGKSVPVESFLGALDNIGADLVSLQRELSTADPHGLAAKHGVEPIEDAILDARTPASCSALVKVIQGLDFLVTISTTTTHIAAAMGKRVLLIVAQRQGPQWFWRVQASHGKCFYPTVKVCLGEFENVDDWWKGPLESVRASLSRPLTRQFGVELARHREACH